MQVSENVAAAGWLSTSGTAPADLIAVGPIGFQAYARLQYADSTLPDSDEPVTDIALVRGAATILREFTTTPDDCYFCVWDGYAGSFLDAELARETKHVRLPDREYVLFIGPLATLSAWEQLFGRGEAAPAPAFMWPRDRSWCFTSDVDTDWAGIGSTAVAIEELVTRNAHVDRLPGPGSA